MLITKKELINLKACKSGFDRFVKQTNNTDKPIKVSSLIGGINTFEDLVWLANKKFPKERLVRFACDCALINVKLIKPYVDDYEYIVEFLKNPTLNATASDTTAYSAYSAYSTSTSHDDRAAAYTAYAAARSMTTIRFLTLMFYSVSDAFSISPEKVNDLFKKLFS